MTETNKKLIANNFPFEIEFNGICNTSLFPIINKQNTEELVEIIPEHLNQKNLSVFKNYNYKNSLKESQKIAFFRGRELRATNVDLNTNHCNYKGNVYKNSSTKPFSNIPKPLIQINSDSYLHPLNGEEYEFDSMDIWQHDFAPTSTLDSPLMGLKDWLNVSHMIHDTITEEEMSQ